MPLDFVMDQMFQRLNRSLFLLIRGVYNLVNQPNQVEIKNSIWTKNRPEFWFLFFKNFNFRFDYSFQSRLTELKGKQFFFFFCKGKRLFFFITNFYHIRIYLRISPPRLQLFGQQNTETRKEGRRWHNSIY